MVIAFALANIFHESFRTAIVNQLGMHRYCLLPTPIMKLSRLIENRYNDLSLT